MGVSAEVTAGRFRVRQACDVEIVARRDAPLRRGQTVEFQMPNSWLLVSGPSFTRQLQCDDRRGEHYVCVDAGEGARFDIAIRERNLPFTGGRARHGRHVVAALAEGQVPAGRPIRIRYANTFAPYVAETEEVWLRVGGEAPEAAPTLTVTPGEARVLRLIAPSHARPGVPFDVLAVSLDEFDNVSCTRYDGRTMRYGEKAVVAENLSFTGSARVSVALTMEGVFRFRMDEAVSNAVRVSRDRTGPFWGDLHIHTKISQDAQGTDPYAYARCASGLDFAATADHCQSCGREGYEQIIRWAEQADEPGRFVTLLADERNPGDFSTPSRPNAGHYNVYCRDLQTFRSAVASPGDGAFVNPLAESEGSRPRLDAEKIMFVPHHTGIVWRDLDAGGGSLVSMEDALDGLALRAVMEIYSHHGQSELYSPQHVLSYEFNRMRNPERRANTSSPGPHYAQDYWLARRRLGVIASSDEHSGQGGRPHGGLAAVWADELTREGIFDALRRRRCYATTGERILVDFSVGGAAMGGCVRAEAGPLPVRLAVWGTERLVRVEVLRHRFDRDDGFRPVLSASPRPESTDAAFDFQDEFIGPCMYYARVVQEPLTWPGMAWTSPVWIDA